MREEIVTGVILALGLGLVYLALNLVAFLITFDMDQVVDEVVPSFEPERKDKQDNNHG